MLAVLCRTGSLLPDPNRAKVGGRIMGQIGNIAAVNIHHKHIHIAVKIGLE
jgi:hypothetical protein